MTVTQNLARVMVQEGCAHVFTLMGAGNLWLIDELARVHGVRIHHLRHENGAVGAADGFARATGEVGWSTVTQGPGFTNTLTAVVTAARANTPMVLLVSDSSNLDPDRFPFAGRVQALRPEAVLDPLGIRVVRLSEGPEAADELRAAVRHARRDRHTVVVVLPAGLDKVDGGAPIPLPDADPEPPRPQPSPEAIRAAADLLATSERPLVLAGYGAVLSDAGSAVAALAEALACPVTTTVHASGLLGDDPRVLGPFGGFSTGAVERAIEDADALVVLGSSLDTFHTRKGAFLRGRRVVRVDRNAQRAATDADVALHGDVAVSAAALAAEIVARPPRPRASVPDVSPDAEDLSRDGRLDPRAVSRELDRVLPEDRRVFVDNGHFGAFPVLHMRHRGPRSLIWLPEFGAVGSALAASFAGAVSDPATQSVLFIGDCGLYMTLGDLETVVRERAPLVVVAMNDGAAGSELVHMSDWGVPPEQAIFGYADLAALAAGMGAQAAPIRRIADIAPAVAAWDRSGPLLLDCHLRRDVRSPIYAHA